MASKERQLKDVRDFFVEIERSIRRFQMKTGADNQYITLLLGALINDYRAKTPRIEDFNKEAFAIARLSKSCWN